MKRHVAGTLGAEESFRLSARGCCKLGWVFKFGFVRRSSVVEGDGVRGVGGIPGRRWF